jgi:DNA-binding CsgD family transcriptional regulator
MSVRLTERQEQCLRLSVTMTDKEIARVLGISASTVDKHVREATRRLGVTRRKEALRLLGDKPPYASAAIPEKAAEGPVQAVGAEASGHSIVPVTPDRSLYGLYTRPPRSIKVRTLAVLGWAAVGAVVLVTVVGLIGMVFGVADGFAPAGTNP